MEIIMNQIPFLDLIVPPSHEPISLTEAKNALRVDSNADDKHIQNLIKAARVMAEEYLRRALITQTWQLQYDGYAPSVVNLPRGPVQSIGSVKTIDINWNEVAISANLYRLNAGKETLMFDSAPVAQIVQIQYTSGYGSADAVPAAIRQGILAHVMAMYDNNMQNKGLPEETILFYARYRVARL